MKSDLLALSAIVLWASLAALGVSLSRVPPFMLTGLGLLVGSAVSIPWSGRRLAAWRVPPTTLALGVYGLFGFHLLLFMALRTAPPVEANLINYLWPLGMVVLAPVVLPGISLKPLHIVAALLGFGGAVVAILGRDSNKAGVLTGGFQPGYLFALGSAVIWSTYSLATHRIASFPTAAVGGFAAVSGGLALLIHGMFEPAVSLSARDLMLIGVLGIGPLGGAFFLWDAAIKRGDPMRIGLLAFLTPLLSTIVIAVSTRQPLRLHVAIAAVMIVMAAVMGHLAAKER